MILLVVLGGAAAAGGVVMLVMELTRHPQPGAPPGRSLRSLSSAAGRRAAIAVVAGLGVLAITRWPVAALSVAAAIIFMPKLTFVGSQRRRTAMLEGLEHWVRRLSDMLTASRGLEDALELSARTAPASIAGPVNALAARLAARMGTEAALRAFATEINDLAGDRIAAALIIASSRRGGGARDVLTALATILARDVAARREIEAERAQHRTTVKWISMFVVGFTVFAVVNHSYSAPYGTVTGQLVMALVAALYAAGFWWLHHLGTMPAPGRFLDSPVEPAAPAGTAIGPWRPQ